MSPGAFLSILERFSFDASLLLLNPKTTLDKGKGADGAVTQDDSANRPETESPASSGGDSAQDVQELLRVVSPALARLLSFDHLR